MGVRSTKKAYKQARDYVKTLLPNFTVEKLNENASWHFYATPEAITRLCNDTNKNEVILRAAYMLGWAGEV